MVHSEILDIFFSTLLLQQDAYIKLEEEDSSLQVCNTEDNAGLVTTMENMEEHLPLNADMTAYGIEDINAELDGETLSIKSMEGLKYFTKMPLSWDASKILVEEM